MYTMGNSLNDTFGGWGKKRLLKKKRGERREKEGKKPNTFRPLSTKLHVR